MKAFLFICLLGTCVPALALTPAEPLIVRSTIDAHYLTLQLANLEQQRVDVTLIRLDSEVELFRQRVKRHNGYRSQLDLSQLRAGRYLVTVQKGDTLRRLVILKTATGIMCSDWK
jgi:hypothetical protein